MKLRVQTAFLCALALACAFLVSTSHGATLPEEENAAAAETSPELRQKRQADDEDSAETTSTEDDAGDGVNTTAVEDRQYGACYLTPSQCPGQSIDYQRCTCVPYVNDYNNYQSGNIPIACPIGQTRTSQGDCVDDDNNDSNNCPAANQYWNRNTGRCEYTNRQYGTNCRSDETYNYQTQRCEYNNGGYVNCDPGMTYNSNTRRCEYSNTYTDLQVRCPIGQVLSSNGCVDDNSDGSRTGTTSNRCANGMYWDNNQQRCQYLYNRQFTCGNGQRFDAQLQRCVSDSQVRCPIGQVPDSSGFCVDDVNRGTQTQYQCQGGQFWDNQRRQCVCQNGQTWDYTQRQCVWNGNQRGFNQAGACPRNAVQDSQYQCRCNNNNHAYDRIRNACVNRRNTCRQGMVQDNVTGCRCVNTQLIYDIIRNLCVCPSGQTWNVNQRQCVYSG